MSSSWLILVFSTIWCALMEGKAKLPCDKYQFRGMPVKSLYFSSYFKIPFFREMPNLFIFYKEQLFWIKSNYLCPVWAPNTRQTTVHCWYYILDLLLRFLSSSSVNVKLASSSSKAMKYKNGKSSWWNTQAMDTQYWKNHHPLLVR